MAQAKAITANPTVKAVLEYLNTKSSSSVPTGAICFFATTAIPTGWLLCNGSNVSRTEYAALLRQSEQSSAQETERLPLRFRILTSDLLKAQLTPRRSDSTSKLGYPT